MTPKTAVVFNANDPQIPQAHLFVQSLRDPLRGNYDGDIWIVSTSLSSNAKRYLDLMNIHYIEDPMDFLLDWSGWRPAAEFTRSTKSKSLLPMTKLQEGAKRLQEEAGRAQEEVKRIQLKPQVAPPMIPARIRSCLKYLVKRALFLENPKDRVKQDILRAQEETKQAQEKARRAQEKARRAQEKALRDYFVKYRNKRQSKLLFLNFIEAHGEEYEKVILCDTDILVQSPISEIFDQVIDDRLYYWREEYPILPGTSLWNKNLAYKKLMAGKNRNVGFGKHEINIGFLGGKPQSMQKILSLQKELYLAEEHVKLIPHGWHEQDYFRLLRGLNPDLFALFKEGSVIHLCDGGKMLIKETKPVEFRYLISGTKPTIIHFAGGTWAQFDSVNKTYRMEAKDFFLYYVNSQS